jgi:phage terminase large subunit GpA-like protein
MTTLVDPEELTDQTAKEAWQRKRADIFRACFTPPPRLTISEWADRYRYLSNKNSAEPGPWRTDRVPFLREILDTISDPTIRQVVVMKCAQIAYTEGVIGNTIGYHVHQRPCPMMIVQPAEADAEDWSKDKLASMIEATPVLRSRVADAKAKTSGNTILGKTFAGGFLRVTGATSPKGLRRTSVKVILFDEVDGYPHSAGSEGDPIELGRKRTTTFWDRKEVMGSTPTLKGLSRIEKAFNSSDQRHYHVPCPHCGHEQVLRWGGKDSAYGIKFEYEQLDGRRVVKPDSVFYLCERCASPIEEHDKHDMVAVGRWIAKNPGSPTPGFHLNALISPFDAVRWSNLVQEWLDAQEDRDMLQVFINTRLGETYEERGQVVTPEGLARRAEQYPDEVPTGVGVLTAGVDVQGDRLELLVRGWGADEESWLISHHRIYGDPQRQSVWEQLEMLLLKAHHHECGQKLRIAATMIDSGFAADAVYRFVKPRQGRGVYASKGSNNAAAPPLSRATRANRDGVKLFTIGTYAMKDVLFSRLRKEKPGAGFIHFRGYDAERCNGADAEYYAQFAAEKLIVKKVAGRAVREYRQVRDRNEAIDLEVGALAALHALGAPIRNHLGAFAEKLRKPPSTSTKTPAARRGRRVRSKGVEV